MTESAEKNFPAYSHLPLLVALVLPDICARYRGKPCGDD